MGKKKALGIEDISDKVARDIILDFKQVFKQLINTPNFDISRIDEIHSKTWDNDLRNIVMNSLQQEISLNHKKWMDNFLNITRRIKYYAYKTYKKENTYDYSWHELPIGDYYIISDDTYYTINLSSDIDSFGYNKSFFYRKHHNCGKQLLFCSIEKYNGKIGKNNIKLDKEFSFIYDADNKKVLDILDLSIVFENSKEEYILIKEYPNGQWR